MKVKWILGWLIASMLLVCAPMVTVTGCASAPRNAFVASGVTHVTVRAALLGWNEHLKTEYALIDIQKATDPETAAKRRAALHEQENKVKRASRQYQAAQLAVLNSAQAFSKLPPNSPDVAASQDRLEAAVAAASLSLSNLVTLVEPFIVKPK